MTTHEQVMERQTLSSSSSLLSVGAPSFGGGGSFETMDFSMPSYDGSISSSKSAPPSFTATFSDSTETASTPAVDKEAEKAKVCFKGYLILQSFIHNCSHNRMC